MTEENDKLKNILDKVLDLFNENDVSPEDGAFLSANLLAGAVSRIDPNIAESLLAEVLRSNPAPSTFRASNKPYSVIGMDRGWGLDPVLIDEEH